MTKPLIEWQSVASVRSYVTGNGVLNLFRNTIVITAHFYLPLWSIAALFALPTMVLFDLLPWQIKDYELTLQSIGVPFVVVAIYFASFVIVGEVSEICLGGTASLSKAIDRISIRGVGRLLGTDIIVWITTAFAFAVIAFPVLLLARFLHVDMMLIIAPVVAVLAVLLILTLFLFTAQVVVVERLYWFSALKRSASLALRSKLPSFGIALFFVLFSAVLKIVTAIPNYKEVILLFTDPGVAHPSPLWKDIASSFLYTAYIPIPNIFLTLAYYHLRRKAGELSAGALMDIKAYEAS